MGAVRFVCALAIVGTLLGTAAVASADDSFLGPYVWGKPFVVDTNDGGLYTPPRPDLKVACAAVTLCVGVDDFGGLVTSTDPARQASWRFEQLTTNTCNSSCGLFDGLACPSVTLCIAFDGHGQVFTSRSPADGAGSWTAKTVGSPTFHRLACVSDTLCLAGDRGGILLSTDPAGESWEPVTFDTAPCPAYDTCQSPTPAIGPVSCVSAQLCVAGDTSGRVFASADPAHPAAWQEVFADPAQVLGAHQYIQATIDALACVTPRRCFGSDGAGNTITSADPLTPGSWTSTPNRVGRSSPAPFSQITCPGSDRCVAVFGDDVLAMADGPEETSSFIGYRLKLLYGSSISCPDARTCFVASQDGGISRGHAPEYTAADLRRLLRAELVPTQRLTVATPVGAAVDIAWFSGAKLVASAGRRFDRPGKRAMTMRLTRLGRRLRDHHPRRSVTARAVLVAPGHSPLQASRRLRPRWTLSRPQ